MLCPMLCPMLCQMLCPVLCPMLCPVLCPVRGAPPGVPREATVGQRAAAAWMRAMTSRSRRASAAVLRLGAPSRTSAAKASISRW